MKHVVIAFGGLVSSFFFACGSAPVNDPGVAPPTIDTSCDATQMNGYNVCYPTSDIGTGARSGTSSSAVPGNRIANFAFTGYAATDVNAILQNGQPPSATKTIHLGDYFDPQQQGVPNIIGGVPIKIIHLTVAALWCGPCNEETDFIAGSNYTGANTANASFASELAPLGVVFVQAIDDGNVVGTGATINDLNTWLNRHNNDFTTMVDPGNQNLGVFFDAAAVPFNANIDARSMEILSTDVGFDTELDNTIKTTWLKWIDSNPPKQ
jgi:hypothetical protein